MDVRLVVTTGRHAGKAVPITRNKFFIGRSPKCQLTLSSDSVSRHHCAILVGKGIVAVHDLGSRTGTYLNGKKVERQKRLQTGDKLQRGKVKVLNHPTTAHNSYSYSLIHNSPLEQLKHFLVSSR